MMNLEKLVLSIGLNDKDTKTQLVTTEHAMEVIKDAVLPLGGATIIPGCIGIYQHDDGTIVCENSVQVVFYGAEMEAVKTAAQSIGRALNQESVALEVSTIQSAFIAC